VFDATGGDARIGRLGFRAGARGLGKAFALAWRSDPRSLVGRAACTVALGLVPVLTAWQFKQFIDLIAAASPEGFGTLVTPVASLVLLGLLAAVLPELGTYATDQGGRALGLAAQRRLYGALTRLTGIRRYEDPEFHDRIQMAAGAGPAGPAQIVGSMFSVLQGVLIVAGFVGTLAVFNPIMVLVVAVAAVPTMRAELLLSRGKSRMMWELSPAARREMFYSNLLTDVTAAKEIRLYGLGALFAGRMADELGRVNDGHRRMGRRELRVQGLLAGLGSLVIGAGLLWAAGAAAGGRLTVGEVAVFFSAVVGVQGGTYLIIQNLRQGHTALVLFGHFLHIEEAGPDLPVPAETRAVPPLRDAIVLEDVWFRYSAEHPWILRGASLTVPAGAATALVGLNGAGKSTIVKLLCRFYDPDRGRILWDGVDLREVDPAELRARIGTVFQDFGRYDLSAAENIGLGDVERLANRDEIALAAKHAGVHDTVATLPRGYDTDLTRMFGEPGGVVLSGGQWQRLALARALMRRDRDLLILDEPSSGLDAEAEHEVHQALREYRRDRASVLISHRLSTVRGADAIVVLDGGVVVERGRHAELMAAGGVYARLFTLQAAGYQDAEEAC